MGYIQEKEMSNFQGDCGCECLPSSGWCETHKRFVRIVYTDGMTSDEMDYNDEQIEVENDRICEE